MNRPYSDRPLDRFNIGFLAALHLAALVAVPWFALTVGVAWADIGAAVVLWILTGLGITGGYHRLFSHKGWSAHRAVEVVLACLGGAAAQNSVLAWAADHRRHHSRVDTEQDPYNAHWGFWWSHMGWIIRDDPFQTGEESIPDLARDPFLQFQHRHYVLLAAAVNLLLVVCAGLVTGRMLGAFVVAGLARVVVVQHFTFTINSLSHMWGSQPFSAANSSRDNWLLGVITLGEGYHNYHHAFETDYRNGIAWYAFDPTKWLIWSLSKLGLADNLRRTPVDVVLRRRFEEGRSTLADRMEQYLDDAASEWMAQARVKRESLLETANGMVEQLQGNQLALAEQAEAFRGHVRARADDMHKQLQGQAEDLRERLRQHVAEADLAVEQALADLKSQRQELARTLRARAQATSEAVRQQLEAELAHLREALRQAQRDARVAMRRWERAIADARSGALPELA